MQVSGLNKLLNQFYTDSCTHLILMKKFLSQQLTRAKLYLHLVLSKDRFIILCYIKIGLEQHEDE